MALSIFLWLPHLQGQSPIFRQYTVEHGLPSNVIYQLLEDHLGYIWLASESGVSRFDGLQFTNFSREDGLPHNEVLALMQDSQQRIWFGALNGSVGYYHDGRFHNSNTDPWLASMSFSSMVWSIYEDSQQRIWISSQFDGIHCLNPDSSIVNIPYALFPNLHANPVVTEDLHQNIILVYRNTLASDVTPYNLNDPSRPTQHPFDITQFSTAAIVQLLEAGVNLVSLDSTSGLSASSAIPAGLLTHVKVYPDSTGWFYGADFPLYRIRLQGSRMLVEDSISGISASAIMQDREQNTWFSTLDQGIFVLPANRIMAFRKADGLSDELVHSVLAGAGNTIFCGTNEGMLNVIKPSGIVSLDLNGGALNRNNRVLNLMLDPNGQLWCLADRSLVALDTSTLTISVDPVVAGAKQSVWYRDRLIMAASTGLNQLGDDHQFQRLWDNRTTSLAMDPQGIVWVGTTNGLYAYDGDTVTRYQPADGSFDHLVTAIVCGPETKYIATNGSGIFVLRHDSIHQWTTADGLTSNIIRSLFLAPDQQLWAATNAGISRVQWFGWDSIQVMDITTSEGLASNDIKACQVLENGDVLVATAKGLAYFNQDEVTSNFDPPLVYLEDLQVNGSGIDQQSPMAFKHWQNNIEFRFTGISHKSAGRVSFRYRLTPQDPRWVTTRNLTARYAGLAPGSYTFEVEAIAKDGTASIAPARWEFRIRPHFSQTWWFRALIGLSLSAIIIALIVIRFRQLKRSAAQRMQVLELEQKALLTQMNPHFIYNSLSSIQYFITANEKRLANRYLVQFSRLIRNILTSSRHQAISLEREIELLRQYLTLESLRYGEAFAHRFDHPAEEIASTIYIPSMMIQPILENAIVHGISGLAGQGRQGRITLRLEVNEDYVQCIIEDNGRGRDHARAINSKRASDREGMALKIIRERLQLLHGLHDQANLSISDLYTDQGLPAGTRVNLLLPCLDLQKSRYAPTSHQTPSHL
ncbi:MAG: two-component regulator propeller domain-containing protein [Bacteroidota bacterium]